jgi:hypothetical protein
MVLLVLRLATFVLDLSSKNAVAKASVLILESAHRFRRVEGYKTTGWNYVVSAMRLNTKIVPEEFLPTRSALPT